MKKVNWLVVLGGAVVGIAAVLLTFLGNPANMGFCIACFLRDITGACGMHGAAVVQYVRPEIPGLVIGAFIMALATKEFRAKAGSSPAIRFILGMLVMIGALVFLGCPLRMGPGTPQAPNKHCYIMARAILFKEKADRVICCPKL